jgi:WD40 repeat protein
VVSPDGKLLVVASESGEIGFYDASTLDMIEVSRSNLSSIFSIAFSPNGKRLVLSSGGDAGISIWDTTIRQELVTLSSYRSTLSAVEFTDDGDTLLTRESSGRGRCEFGSRPLWKKLKNWSVKVGHGHMPRYSPRRLRHQR